MRECLPRTSLRGQWAAAGSLLGDGAGLRQRRGQGGYIHKRGHPPLPPHPTHCPGHPTDLRGEGREADVAGGERTAAGPPVHAGCDGVLKPRQVPDLHTARGQQVRAGQQIGGEKCPQSATGPRSADRMARLPRSRSAGRSGRAARPMPPTCAAALTWLPTPALAPNGDAPTSRNPPPNPLKPRLDAAVHARRQQRELHHARRTTQHAMPVPPPPHPPP